MTNIRIGLMTAAAALLLAGAAGAQDTVKPDVMKHVEAGRALAGKASPVGLLLCNGALPAAKKDKLPNVAALQARGGVAGQPPEPAKVFDNLYYLGIRHVSAWAVNTPDGIILFDTLDNHTEAADAIEGGLRKLGLDPSRIKYIVVTHGHGDHYGGAKYLADKYKAHVLMSEADWSYMADRFAHDKPHPGWDGPPTRDMVVTDGQKLTLGGETVTLYVTPGHTPGTISSLIPVTDHGQKHLVAQWGGTGFNFPHSQENFKIYADSAARFSDIVKKAGADVPLSNHPETDSAIVKNDLLKTRGSGPNPYVLGKTETANFMMAFSECARAQEMTY
jgi:metallo-beta-lactamase class B